MSGRVPLVIFRPEPFFPREELPAEARRKDHSPGCGGSVACGARGNPRCDSGDGDVRGFVRRTYEDHYGPAGARGRRVKEHRPRGARCRGRPGRGVRRGGAVAPPAIPMHPPKPRDTSSPSVRPFTPPVLLVCPAERAATVNSGAQAPHGEGSTADLRRSIAMWAHKRRRFVPEGSSVAFLAASARTFRTTARRVPRCPRGRLRTATPGGGTREESQSGFRPRTWCRPGGAARSCAPTSGVSRAASGWRGCRRPRGQGQHGIRPCHGTSGTHPRAREVRGRFRRPRPSTTTCPGRVIGPTGGRGNGVVGVVPPAAVHLAGPGVPGVSVHRGG